MANSKEYELAIKIAGKIESSFKNSMGLTEKQLKNIARQAANSSNAMGNSWSTGFKDVEKGLNKVDSAAEKVFGAMVTTATVAATAIAGIATASISVGASFEAQMSTVQSLSGATTQELNTLTEKAKEMGATTSFSATEAGQAMEYMALAGWKSADMVNGIEGIMNLAAASGEELASVSDIVTDGLTAFGKSADYAGTMADIMAATSSNANTDVAGMGEAFTYAASVAGSLGYSVQDTSLAVGLMANSGIKASQAGTALRKILTSTAQGIDISSKAMGDYTIQTADSTGKMRELSDIMEDLRKAFSTMSEQERAFNAENIAGKTGMSGLLAIVNAAEADYNKLSNAINNSSGAAERMSKIKLDNLQGDVTLLKSATEGLGIDIYDQMKTGLRNGVQGITEIVGSIAKYLQNNRFIEEWGERIQRALPSVIRRLKETGKAIGEFAKPFLEIGKWMIANPAVVEGTLAGIGTTIISLKLAVGVHNLAQSFVGLATVLTNPFALAILAVGAAIGGAAGLAIYVKKCREEMKKANLAEHFGDMSLSLEELEDVAKRIVDNGTMDKLNEAMGQFEAMDGIKQNIQDAVSAMKKMNWKVEIGMELSDSEMADYQDNITSFIAETQNLVQQQQYAMSMNLELFTDNDAEGRSIREKFNQFYQNNYDTVAQLGTDLQETVNAAFEDGLLTIDEAQKIQDLQAQIANISEKIAGSEFDAKLEVLGLKYSGGELDAESFANLQAEIQEQVNAAVSQYDEALQMNIASAKVMLDEGAIDFTEYTNMVDEFRENYLDNVGDIELRAQSFQLNTIKDQYSEELTTFGQAMQEELKDAMAGIGSEDEVMNYRVEETFDNMLGQLKNGTLSQDTQDAIASLVEAMQPSDDALEKLASQYEALGKEVPESIKEGMSQAAKVKAATGDEGSIWTSMAGYINNNEEYVKITEELKQQGADIPEELSRGISDNKIVMSKAANDLYMYTNQQILEKFSKEFFVKAKVKVDIDADYAGKIPSKTLKGYATGGIITKPTLATFAEEGPEAAIPLDGSQRAKSLWLQAGEMLGMTSQAERSVETLERTGGNTSTSIAYSPTINFYGGAPTKQDITDANDEAQRNFERMMEKYTRENRLRFR